MINILLDNNFKINIVRNNDYMKNISKIMVTALSCFMIAIPITNNIYADEENTSTEYQSLQVGDSYSVIEDIDALGFPADYDDFVDKIKEIKDSNPDLSPEQILKEYEDMYCNAAQPAGWYESWTALTLSEKILIATNPVNAAITKELANNAVAKTAELYGYNGLGDNTDAFRHAYWNALMTARINKGWAAAYATAPEDRNTSGNESDGYSKVAHKKMDLHNNKKGRNLVKWNDLLTKDEVFAQRVQGIMTNNASTGLYWLH